jgi:hypothetical protein
MASKGKKVDIKGRYRQSAFDRTWCVRTYSRSHQHAARTTVARTLHPRTRAASRSHAAAPTDARSITVARGSTHAARSHAATHGATYGRTQHPTFARSLQPALAVICVRPHLRAFKRTHDSALVATAVIYGRTCALRSTTNNWCVRT